MWTSLNIPRTILGASRETQYAPDTLRDLERRGIVSPPRDTAGRRIYFDEHVAAIQAYREKQRQAAARRRG